MIFTLTEEASEKVKKSKRSGLVVWSVLLVVVCYLFVIVYRRGKGLFVVCLLLQENFVNLSV